MLYWVCIQELNLMVLSVTQTGENRRHREFQLLFGIYEEPVANLVFKSSIFELVFINNNYLYEDLHILSELELQKCVFKFLY